MGESLIVVTIEPQHQELPTCEERWRAVARLLRHAGQSNADRSNSCFQIVARDIDRTLPSAGINDGVAVIGRAILPAVGAGSCLAVSAKMTDMSKIEVDSYLAALEEPKRSTLDALRRTILEVIPSAEQGMSYGVPAFRLEGKVVAGFAAFKNHLSYLPHSGSVFPELEADLADYKTSKGALQFPIDRSLPKALVKKLIEVRSEQVLRH